MAIRDKGNKLYKAIDNYVVFDLETTDFCVNDNCKIIEISALKVRDNQVVDKFTTLVNPQMHIPSSATQVNHITDDMVADAPTIEEVFDKFLEFIGSDVLIGHNIDTFDYNIIYDLYEKFKFDSFQNEYIDTLNLARQCFSELDNHKLTTLAEHLDININEAHRAESDCYTTNELYQKLKPLIGKSYARTVPINKKKEQFATTKCSQDSQNIFYGKTCIVYGAFKSIDSDKIKSLLNALGAEYIDYFCYTADYLILGDEMHSKYVKRVPDELIDSIALRTNIRVLSEYDFIRYSDIIISTQSNKLDVDFLFDVSNKKICLTGDFACGGKDKLINSLVADGAVVKHDVIKTLDYLVIGSLGSDDWKDGKGLKRIKAENFNQKGANINIISEREFIVIKE